MRYDSLRIVKTFLRIRNVGLGGLWNDQKQFLVVCTTQSGVGQNGTMRTSSSSRRRHRRQRKARGEEFLLDASRWTQLQFCHNKCGQGLLPSTGRLTPRSHFLSRSRVARFGNGGNRAIDQCAWQKHRAQILRSIRCQFMQRPQIIHTGINYRGARSSTSLDRLSSVRG